MKDDDDESDCWEDDIPADYWRMSEPERIAYWNAKRSTTNWSNLGCAAVLIAAALAWAVVASVGAIYR